MAEDKRNDKGEGFKGLKKSDHESLKKATEMYARVTGEPVANVQNIPVLPEEEGDPSAISKLADEQLTQQAEATAKAEEAAQALRRAEAGLDENGHPKSGPPEPILAPIAAKQAETVENLKAGREPAKRERERDTLPGRAEPKGGASRVSVSG
jgi:hypothetical protein